MIFCGCNLWRSSLRSAVNKSEASIGIKNEFADDQYALPYGVLRFVEIVFAIKNINWY